MSEYKANLGLVAAQDKPSWQDAGKGHCVPAPTSRGLRAVIGAVWVGGLLSVPFIVEIVKCFN